MGTPAATKVVGGAVVAGCGAFLGIVATVKTYAMWVPVQPCDDTPQFSYVACVAPSAPAWTQALGAALGAVVLTVFAILLVRRLGW